MKINTKSSAQNITLIGLFTALVVALSQIAFPLPSGVPVTLQTFAISFCGYTLGWKRGLSSMCAYITLGLIGLPVFSNFGGGLGVVFGLTGGFIWGFMLLALMCGIGNKQNNPVISILIGFIGLVLCHFFGVLQFSFINSTPLIKSIFLVSVPYLIKDIVSVAGAYFIARAARKALAKSKMGKEFN